MKNLRKVQSLAKVIYGFTIVAMIFIIIGLIACVAGAIGVDTYYDYIMDAIEEADAELELDPEIMAMTKEDMVAYCIVGIVECAVSLVMASFVVNFYAFEVKAGDPFDKKVTKKMRKLAVAHIIVPVIGVIVLSIVVSARNLPVEISSAGGVVTGIVYFIIARICDYGADLKDRESDYIPEARPSRPRADRSEYYTDYRYRDNGRNR